MADVLTSITGTQFLKGDRATAHYRPSAVGGGFRSYALDRDPLFRLVDIPRMQKDPQVRYAIRILRANLSPAQIHWNVEGNPRVGAFALQQMRRVWNNHFNDLASYVVHGWMTGEVSYKPVRSRIEFDRLDPVHPLDAKPLVAKGRKRRSELIGIRVSNGNGEGFDIARPHAFWFAGEAEYGQLYGPSRYQGMWAPFLEKRGRGGLIEARRVWNRKNIFSGGTMYHPPGDAETGDPGSSTARPYADFAREMLEKYENGATIAFPNVTDAMGNQLWQHTPASAADPPTWISDQLMSLDDEILIGAGIPPEIINADNVGGWSGRLIPALMFFCMIDEMAGLCCNVVDQQIIRPLCVLNYRNTDYRLFHQSLAEKILREASQPKQGQAAAAMTTPIVPDPNDQHDGAELSMWRDRVAKRIRRRAGQAGGVAT